MKETLTGEKLTFEVFYPHAPERVWRALTDPTALKRWLMPTDFRPRLGHKFRFAEPKADRGEHPIRCEVVELDAPHRLAYTWQSERDAEPTLVIWTLEPVEGGTKVRLEHAAPALAGCLAFHAEVGSNWNNALKTGLPVNLDTTPRRHIGRIHLPAAGANVRCISRSQSVLRVGSGIVLLAPENPSSEILTSDYPNARTPNTLLRRKEQTHATHR